jgi:hypothetical protein
LFLYPAQQSPIKANFVFNPENKMQKNGWLFKRLTWLALCAVVFASLAPSVSRFLAQPELSILSEICSSNGKKLTFSDFSGNQSKPQGMTSDEHCGYCVLQHHTPFVASSSHSFSVPILPTDRIAIGSGGSTFFKRSVRNAHQSRAPPVVS